MKIALVSPEFPHSAKVPMVPPILEYLGALTLREAPDTRLSLHDANQRPVDPAALDADLVGISVWTATAPWAYRFADACRAAGKRVVLGGIHATACPDEAARHADAVVVGEAESCWGEALADARAGRLKARYQGVQRPLDGLVTPIDAGLEGNYRFRAFFTMRGCPYACSFCSVHHFFGRDVRYRPVAEVAAEVEARAGRVWFNGDDNIWGADPGRAVQLFDALARGSRRAWYGFGDLRSVQGRDGERMVQAARRSGLFSVWAGWESESGQSLKAFGAAGKQGRDRVEAVRRLQGQGLEVVLFMVLGAREDDFDSYRRTLELADQLRVGVHPVLLTPLPGTALWHAYQPHLLPGLGWEAFTGVRATFSHPDPALTPEVRERAFHELVRELNRPRRIARRLTAIAPSGFPAVHGLALMKQLPMRRALAKAREAWLAEHPSPPPLPGPIVAPPAPAPAPEAVPGPAPAGALAPVAVKAHRLTLIGWATAALGSLAAEAQAHLAGAGELAATMDRAGETLEGVAIGALALAVGAGAVRWRTSPPPAAHRRLILTRAAVSLGVALAVHALLAAV